LSSARERGSYVATTFFGLEDVLADELRALGASDVATGNRAVTFSGDERVAYLAVLTLRTALRVLQPIHRFNARDENQLYRGVREIDWSEWTSNKETLAIDAVVNSKFFTHTKYPALKTKDAIVDQFRERTGKRPSVDVDDPDIRLRVHIAHDETTILLDRSGDSLHKRGYRLEKNPAPLNEILAAGMILISGWDGSRPFVDPMCGSGTLPIEAALIAGNIAPGLIRNVAPKPTGLLDRPLWERLKRDAVSAETPIETEIVGGDRDGAAIAISKRNARKAGVEKSIGFIRSPIARLEPPPNALAIMNPPYGERLKKAEIEEFYSEIGDRLKEAYVGSEAWILSANFAALKRVGLRPSQKMKLYNGALECGFRKYEMYEGSRKRTKHGGD
jgi:putative N6-adenine-specific DNA methylase